MKRYIIISALLVSNTQMAYATPKGDIYAKGTHAYVVDQENRIVRDNFGGCVRSIHWSKETAIPACEGWPKPVKQAEPPKTTKPAPAPVVITQVEPAQQQPAPLAKQPAEEPFPAFRGLFKTNSAELNDEAFGKLDLVVSYLKKYPVKKVIIEGHTDSQGSEAYNQQLSLKRAQAVKNYLINQGIPAERIEAIGLGESQPISENNTPQERQLNRRVQIKLIK